MSEGKIPIFGFSLTRPWPWTMLTPPPGRAPLRLVYSTYALPVERLDTYVALHVNINWDATSATYLNETLGIEVPERTAPEQPYNVIFAVAQWVACVREYSALPLRQRPWHQPLYHWLLGRFTIIQPVPCMPNGNFFRLPNEVLQTVRQRYRQAQSILTRKEA